MNESEFNNCIDATLLAIEEAIDKSGASIEYENIAGILSLIFDDGSQVIINRQSVASQLWLAARSGGFHFDWSDEEGAWLNSRDGAHLHTVLNTVCSEQAGEKIEFFD